MTPNTGVTAGLELNLMCVKFVGSDSLLRPLSGCLSFSWCCGNWLRGISDECPMINCESEKLPTLVWDWSVCLVRMICDSVVSVLFAIGGAEVCLLFWMWKLVFQDVKPDRGSEKCAT